MKVLAAGLLLWLTAGPVAAADQGSSFPASLRAQIEALARDHGFAVQGTERIGETDAVKVRGPVDHRLNRLLAGYNFITYHDASGKIISVEIIGERANDAAEPQVKDLTVQTDRQGREHYVTAQITGPSGKGRPMRMLVDTGATTVVLPVSLVEELGFQKRLLQEVVVQTANGLTSGHIATLPQIRIADAEAKKVAVTFVPDTQLGGKTLLGMSFLSRFVVTIDDATNEIRLRNRPSR